jgi:putative SOS response-associated peptidase YedK
MSVAGIWSTWKHEGSKERHSFSIMTTKANAFMSKIHDRMPVIIGRDDEDAWLDPDCQDKAKIAKLLRPCPASWLKSYEISTMVNSPRNNRKEVLKPLEK